MDNFKFTVLIALSVFGAYEVGYFVGKDAWRRSIRNYIASDQFNKDIKNFTDTLKKLDGKKSTPSDDHKFQA